MATLWTFGDSYTDFFYPREPRVTDWRTEYIKWKSYVPKVYGEILSDRLNIPLKNMGKGGCDNNHIFHKFCEVCNQINQDDVIIIGWTIPERFRMATRNNQWGYFSINRRTPFIDHNLEVFDLLSKNTIDEILINRSNLIYLNEITNFIKLINISFKKNKIIHWSWDERLTRCGALFFNNPITIRKETNNEVDDGHWCEDGHYEFSNMLINRINNFERKII